MKKKSEIRKTEKIENRKVKFELWSTCCSRCTWHHLLLWAGTWPYYSSTGTCTGIYDQLRYCFFCSNDHSNNWMRMHPKYSWWPCNARKSAADLKEEYEKIVEVGLINGFKRNAVVNIIKKHIQKQILRDTTTLAVVTGDQRKRKAVPYCGPWQNSVTKICRKAGFDAVPNSSCYKMRRFQKSSKDVLPKLKRSGVYRVKCQDNCPAAYIGQSKRAIGVRMKEHLRCTRNNEPEKSTVADHLLAELHTT